jgi:hypothetical protein
MCRAVFASIYQGTLCVPLEIPMSHKEMKQYNRRRYKDFLDNAEDRPYWMWVAVIDPSTCDRCRALDGKVFRFDDPIWKKLLPPIHRGCRCRFRAFTEKNMQERGLKLSQGIEFLP